MSYPGGGYPPAGGGYPPQQGYPPQGGYPQQGGYQGGMPQPAGGGAAPGLPYSATPGGIGFENAGGAGMPGGMPGGPAQPPYGAQSGYPPAGYPPSGYPPQQPAAGGYPGAAPGGYPGAAPASGYPGAAPMGGYPGAAPGGGYPGAAPGGSYPGAAPGGGYPGAAPVGGYPGAAPATGYPGAGPPSGYPGGAPAGGYPGAAPTAPAQGGYGQAGGYGGGNIPGGVPMAGMQNLNIGGKMKEEGTVKPASPFDKENDAEILRKAMKGLGTDEKAIIDILAARSNKQRQEIMLAFKTMYGKDLIKNLESELGGKFETIVLALMKPLPIYDASELNRAIKGLGTDENDLIEILCSRNNAEITEIKAAYKKWYGKDLEKQLMSETSGHFKRLMVSLASAGRQEDKPMDLAKAKQDAKDLYDAGEARWGTDESKFNQILCMRSYEHLRVVFDEYHALSKRTIEQAVSNEMSGDIKQGMLSIVKLVRNKPAFFAEKLYKTMKGAGTKDRDLIRIVVTRCEIDMVQIKQEFYKLYNKSLEGFIGGDTSGDYKKMLLALVGVR
ncbi:Annexin A11 [Lamellibrachia satsuma]|nr:Annexin A11 [Lamellibrachia satsuma]